MDSFRHTNISFISGSRALALTVLVFGLVISYGVVAQAQGVPEAPSEERIAASGISFPVAELGNCANKRECKVYCDDATHMSECIAFAERHGLMNKGEAARARKFSTRLQGAGGPGGCRSHLACESYCQDITNIDECLSFAEEQGIDDQHVREARKVRAHLSSGGRMPGGCRSKQSCEAYCSDFNNAEECLAFAEGAGLSIDDRGDDRGPRGVEQMRKFIELAKSGDTPGGCRDKRSCEAYCGGGENMEECIAFGERMGFIRPEEAALARKTGGRGPGGCTSERECRAHCDDPANRDACFAFAEEHGLIGGEDLRHAKEGFVQLRQGLEHAPPEVAACLKSHLGENIISDIQSGNLVPGLDIGQQVRGCFEKFGGRPDPREIFQRVPPEVLDCARTKLGSEFDALESGGVEFTPETGDVFRVCGDEIRLQSGGLFGPPGGDGDRGGPGRGGPGGRDMLGSFLRSAPPGVGDCLAREVGADVIEEIKAGQRIPDAGFENTVRGCFTEFQPQDSFDVDPHEGDFDRGIRDPGGRGPDGFGPDRRGSDGRPPFLGGPRGGETQTADEAMRRVEGLPPRVQGCVKGLFAGGFNPQDVPLSIEKCMRQFGGEGGSSDRPERFDDGGVEREDSGFRPRRLPFEREGDELDRSFDGAGDVSSPEGLERLKRLREQEIPGPDDLQRLRDEKFKRQFDAARSEGGAFDGRTFDEGRPATADFQRSDFDRVDAFPSPDNFQRPPELDGASRGDFFSPPPQIDPSRDVQSQPVPSDFQPEFRDAGGFVPDEGGSPPPAEGLFRDAAKRFLGR